jgi:hypothetical protein
MHRISKWLALALLGSSPVAQAQPAPSDPAAEATPRGDATRPEATPPEDQPGAEAPTEPAAAVDDAVPAEANGGWGDLATLTAETAEPLHRAKLYGFIDFHVEKVARTPSGVDGAGETVYTRNPIEVDLPNIHVMLQGAIRGRFRYYLNLASPGAGSNTDDEAIVLRNAWLEWPLLGRRLVARVGKTYRRFGLYNELLDAVPTFIGIESPELFDKDHLLLTRTTSVMLYGEAELAGGALQYSATTGNDERLGHAIPLGADLRFVRDGLTVGTSLYRSGAAGPSRAVGDGSPRGGVASWMSEDAFVVVGGFVEWARQGWTIQVEGWQARHDGVRDPAALATLAADGDLNAAQLERFFVGGDPTAAARTEARYDVRTAYLRAGRDVSVRDDLMVTPYLQVDYYDNPETIAAKDLGGDDEAGLADDGRFTKFTLGAVIQPGPAVALKLDGSGHLQTFNGSSEFYPELRLSLSYLWEYAP